MNTFMASGRLIKNAAVLGKTGRVLTFMIVAGSDDTKAGSTKPNLVPCVVFSPDPKMAKVLSEKGKGMPVEIYGHVATSHFEKGGQDIFKTEVVVDSRRLRLAERN